MSKTRAIGGCAALRMKGVALSIALLGCSSTATALELTAPDSELKIRWDNTVKYSTAYRLDNPSERVAAGDPGGPGTELDDGDRNFDRGVINSRFDLLSELDVVYKQVGLRISGAAWYDDVYRRGNDNRSLSVNSRSVPAGEFTEKTRDMMGRKAEILDAFVFMNSDPTAEVPFTVRAGQHSVLYGESLFFGSNGIANAQAPIDVIKALSVPGSQFKEIIRPVGQVSTQVQLTPQMSIGAYYQYEWEKSRLPASGSYFSNADFVGAGAESLLGMAYAGEEKPDSDQFGLQMRFKPGNGDVEYGVYFAQYNDKTPQVIIDPVNGRYGFVYAEKIKTVGASFSTVLGEANVAGEVSYRWDAPLVSGPQVDIGLSSDGLRNPLFALGKTAHAQISTLYLFGGNPVWDGAELLGELAWNRVLSVDENPLARDANTTRDAMAFRMLFTPQYFQVLPGLDISIPIGFGYNLDGNSSAVGAFNGGARQGGDFSIGLKGEYQRKWKFGINYTRYFGDENALLTANTKDPRKGPFMSTAAQSLHDRDFVSLSVQTTF